MSAIHDSFAPLLAPPAHTDHFASSFLHPYHHPAAFDSDRFLAAPYLRAPAYPPAFEYPHSFLPREQPLRGFDPRPPHAGWTPKEEVDDEEQARELLTRRTRSPPHPHLTPPTEPADDLSPSSSNKTYSFVSLPGNAVRKRPRRRYDEIERLYACAWPDCTKAYGTLNHLNAHVSMQRHGPKRSPAEFKELRKQWRQQKKQDAGGVPSGGALPHAAAGGSAEASPQQQQQRRRRGTEPALVPPAGAAPRLSLGDMRFPPHSDEGPSPTSSASDSAHFWQDSAPASPPLGRLPADSTLLTPLPGYRAPSPPALLQHAHQHAHQHQHHAHAHAPLHHAGHSPHAGALLPLASLSPSPRAYDYDKRRTS